MYTILQLSDFHIKERMPEPGNNAIIKSLVVYLQNMKLSNIILVYNGDVIDAETIRDRIDIGASLEEKQKIWDQEAEKAYVKAVDYFDYIMRELKIDNEHVVICCGNHDVNNYYPNTENFNCMYDNQNLKIDYNPNRFNKWLEFCRKMKFFNATFYNTIITIDSFNFVVTNCQWRDKYKNNIKQGLCMNCESIFQLFSEHEAGLAEALIDKSKNNVYVAHNPFGDICENKQFSWPQNKYSSLINKVNDTCILQLFGDKHTSAALGDQFLVGAPLDPNKKEEKGQPIVYRLHKFDEGKILHQAIVYGKGGWKSWYDQTDLVEIYKISKEALKDRALIYLFGEANKDTVLEKIYEFDRYKKKQNWRKVNNFFGLFVNVTVVQPDGRSPRVPYDAYGVIDTVCSAINNHDSENPIVSMTIKGNYRNGKSTFLSIVYLNMLWGFNNGTFRDIPVYIDLEALEMNVGIKEGRANSIKAQVKEILDSIVVLNERFHQKICLIIDGIPQYLYSNDSEYDDINSLIKDYDKFIGHYVYCIDTIDKLQYEFSAFFKESTKYLTYFSDISTQVFGDGPSLYKAYLNAFCDIEGIYNKREIVLRNLKNFHFKNIDYCLTKKIKDVLVREEGEINLAKEIKNKLVTKLGGEQSLSNAAQAAYLLYYAYKDLADIKRIVKVKNDFLIFSIIRHKIYAQFLIAQNYVNIIKKTKKTINRLTDTDKAALNQLYEDEISRFIVESFSYEIQPKTMVDFEKNNYKILDFSGKSLLTYLVSKVKDASELDVILKREENELEESYNDELSKGLQGRKLYEYYVAKRSIEIGFTRNDKEYREENKYIIKLLYDKNERRINRDFFLEFYGDRFKDELRLEEEIFLTGVDFYHTYNMLKLRLKMWTDDSKETELSRLELFTLCDLIQVRLDTPKITHKRVRNSLKKVNANEDGNESLFYNAEYNNENKKHGESILDTALNAIEFYLKKNKSKELTDPFVQYLLFEKRIFKAEKERLAAGNFVYNNNTGALLNTLTQLGSVKKVGWYFSTTPKKLTDEELKMAIEGKEIIESVLEHTYEAYIIGLLYLPNEDKLTKGYKKQDILNMLLIHDLGENEVGDYPPSYYDYDSILRKEREICRAYYLAGQHPEYETMIDYLRLWDGWASNSNDINIRIAKEIDKIQMLYKLLLILKEGKAIFTEERFKNFFLAVGGIRTTQGRVVYNKVVARNIEFVKLAKQYYNYDIVEI